MSRPTFASKIVYESLGIESGEETEEEEVTTSAQEDAAEVPQKPSKSALKKAAKLARTERKQQQKLLAKAQKTSSSSPTSSGTPFESPIIQTSSLEDTVAPSLAAPSKLPRSSQTPSVIEVPITDAEEGTKPRMNGQVHALENHNSTPPPRSDIHDKVSGNLLTTVPSTSSANAYAKTDAPTLSPPEAAPPPPPKEVQALPMAHPPPQPNFNPPADVEKQKKKQNMFERTVWTFIMIGGFLTLLLLGHAYMILLVMVCQTAAYKEVTALFSFKLKASAAEADESEEGGKDPWSTTLNWYFFAVTNYFLYGESIIYYFKHVVFVDSQLTLFATNHRIISFTLYTIGFVGFVMSLKKGHLKQQFSLFCWVHMSLLLIVVSSHFIVNNILEGLIWLWVPASLVICNDVFAYIWGITLGRTPLIALSPKKTVEGFVGAFWSTLVFSVVWGTYFMQFDYMICPVRDLGVSAWSSVTCTPNPVFVWKEWQIWAPAAIFLSKMLGQSITTIPYAPYQIHLLCMACFSSLVAPFGGFFASGFKRAFNIKDFGDSIPGHGGMTDRMDCQFLMGVFTYVYYSSLIRDLHVTVGSVLQTVVSGLSVDEQLELIADLKRYLQGQGISVP